MDINYFSKHIGMDDSEFERYKQDIDGFVVSIAKDIMKVVVIYTVIFSALNMVT